MELVKSISIQNLVAQRDAVVEKVTAAHKLLLEAEQIAESINEKIRASSEMHSYQTINIERACFDHHERRNLATKDGAKDAVPAIDSDLWDLLLKESGLLSFWDAQTRAKWQKQIAEGEMPPLTVANIEATFAQLADARGDMFDSGVVELFRKLSWNYKTNQPVKFGKKIIISYGVSEFWGHDEKLHLEYDARNKLADIERVFRVADGKPERDHRDQFPKVIPHSEQVPFEYFTLRGYKKGTLHLTFTRPELVDQLNKIIAKHHPDALAQAR